MLQFSQFVARHGEIAAQAILENLERFEGVRSNATLSLEERWRRMMQAQIPQQRLAA
jgi:hypothetical protein